MAKVALHREANINFQDDNDKDVIDLDEDDEACEDINVQAGMGEGAPEGMLGNANVWGVCLHMAAVIIER